MTKKVSNTQVRWFRFQRSGLSTPFNTSAEAAHSLIGVQAQMPVAADLAFHNRVMHMSPAKLQEDRLTARSLIRMWGQRNTVHLYSAEDWPLLFHWFTDRKSVMASKLEEAGLGKEFNALVRHFEKRLLKGEPLTYKDVRSHRSYKRLDEVRLSWASQSGDPAGSEWLLGYAVAMKLVREGLACHGPDKDGESTFVHREIWTPNVKWLAEPNADVYAEAARRYMQTYGPATPNDMAAYFGITVTQAKSWIALVSDESTVVSQEGQSKLILTKDSDLLLSTPPPKGKWPVRLLHRFDPYVLGAVGSKDRTWLLAKELVKKVWRPGAQVEAVELSGGEVAGTWRYLRRSKGLVFELSPFSKPTSKRQRDVSRRCDEIAEFLGDAVLEVKWNV